MPNRRPRHAGAPLLLVVSALTWARTAPTSQSQTTVGDNASLPAQRAQAASPVEHFAPDAAQFPTEAKAECSDPQEMLYKTTWYGWQTLAADGLSLLMAGAEQGGVAVGTYVLVAPVIHAAHGAPGKGLGSLALRVLLPISFAMGGMEVSCSIHWGNDPEGDECYPVGLVVGALVGAGAASAIDATLLARQTIALRPSVMPSVAFERGRAWFGLVGEF